jgi:hypothetical protein
MALTTAEVERIKSELGYNLITVGQPYIQSSSLFEQVIQPYLSEGAATTSATTVTAGSPAAVSLTLADATDFEAGSRVVVDVDSFAERSTIRSVSGSVIVVILQKAHAGTYPVAQDSGDTIVREKLAEIWTARVTRGKSQGRGGLKAIVGDVEWYDNGQTAFASSTAEIDVLRDELAAILGVENMWRRRQSAGSRMSVY